MTVTNPISEENYTGNGVTTAFEITFEVIIDSVIHVILDDVRNDQWHLESNFLVFDTAPAAGVHIKIYRKTKIWMPENYRAFGRFNGEKTEQGMDRLVMVLQERSGTSTGPEAPNGFVGGNNISALPTQEGAGVFIENERGTNTGLPVWRTEPIPDPPPDPTIIWAGDPVECRAFGDTSTGTLAFTIMTFKMDFNNEIAGEASCNILNFYMQPASQHVGWVNVDPADGEYFMRVFLLTDNGVGKVLIRDQFVGVNRVPDGTTFRMYTDEADPDVGTYITLDTNFVPAPATATATIRVEICKKMANGFPDNLWAKRTINMEAIYNV